MQIHAGADHMKKSAAIQIRGRRQERMMLKSEPGESPIEAEGTLG
jgi:hypothetical protein